MSKYEKGLVSLILPVYNVEKYLSACVDVCIKQTYKDIEIIIVDDGSTDSSGSICDEYAAKDARIKVIHQANGGLSEARNSGIKAAKGEWLAFIDSDDLVNVRYVELLLEAAVSNDAPMSWCAISEIDENGAKYRPHEVNESISECPIYDGYEDVSKCNVKVFDKVEAEKQFYTMWGIQIALVAWNKLYHKSLFKDENGDAILYASGKIFEDGFTTYKYIYQAEKVAYTDAPLYYYRQRAGSIMKKNSNRNYDAALEAGVERLEFYKKHNENELYKLELNYTIYSPVRFYETADSKEGRKVLKNWFKLVYYNYFIKEKWPMAKRIRMWLFLWSYPLYKAVSSFEGIYNKLGGK